MDVFISNNLLKYRYRYYSLFSLDIINPFFTFQIFVNSPDLWLSLWARRFKWKRKWKRWKWKAYLVGGFLDSFNHEQEITFNGKQSRRPQSWPGFCTISNKIQWNHAHVLMCLWFFDKSGQKYPQDNIHYK